MGSRYRIAIDMDRVRRLLAEGASIAQIAEEMGVAAHTLRYRMTAEGVPPPHDHGAVARQMVEVRAMAQAGRSVGEIAEALGINENTLRWRMKKFGIVARREAGGRPPQVQEPETAAPLPRVGEASVAAPPEPEARAPSALDAELIATGGKYSALALVAARHRLTSQQARSRWHKLGLRVTVVK